MRKENDPRYVKGVSEFDDDMTDDEWFNAMGEPVRAERNGMMFDGILTPQQEGLVKRAALADALAQYRMTAAADVAVAGDALAEAVAEFLR